MYLRHFKGFFHVFYDNKSVSYLSYMYVNVIICKDKTWNTLSQSLVRKRTLKYLKYFIESVKIISKSMENWKCLKNLNIKEILCKEIWVIQSELENRTWVIRSALEKGKWVVQSASESRKWVLRSVSEKGIKSPTTYRYF